MVPRAPSPPPLPYTTLFRSIHGATLLLVPGVVLMAEGGGPPPVPWLLRAGLYLPTIATGRAEALPLRDRKSTRLNSSHPSISYAVFCLKKKQASNRTWP